MNPAIATLLSAILQLQNLVAAAVLAAFAGVALRSFLCAALGQGVLPRHARRPDIPRWQRVLVRLGYLVWGCLVLVMGAVYAAFVLSSVRLGVAALLVAGATLLVIVGSLVVKRLLGLRGPSGLTGMLLRAVLVLGLTVLALVTLMRAGFLNLTEDRPVLLVEVTGATREEAVRWAPAGGATRDERLPTHQVVFRRPADEAIVGEAWIYGDEVAVKGRVLRLSGILNAAGISNLFELTFAFNGYRTLERHNAYPHRAFPLEPVGPLAVHPLWRRTQERLLERWEAGTTEGSPWVIRAATTESTFFPLTDAAGQPIRRTYRLTMTPGGLSAS
jgi:hypothetical protein